MGKYRHKEDTRRKTGEQKRKVFRQGSQGETVSSAISNASETKQDKDWEFPWDLAAWKRLIRAVDKEQCVDQEGERQWQ